MFSNIRKHYRVMMAHSKSLQMRFWMARHDLVVLSNVEKHIFLSKWAISSGSNRPKSRKRPKTCFLALWIIQKCIFVTFEWSNMSHISAKLSRPFSVIKICNIKLIWRTKLDKMADNWMDHSKRPTRCRKKILKYVPDFSRICRFRGEFRKSLNFRFKPS